MQSLAFNMWIAMYGNLTHTPSTRLPFDLQMILKLVYQFARHSEERFEGSYFNYAKL